MGGMMMKGGGKGKGKGGHMMGKKSSHDATDDEDDDRTKHFLDEYIGHHSQSSEHLKELNFEVMEHITYEP